MKKSFIAEYDTKIKCWIVNDIKGFKQVIISKKDLRDENNLNLTVK